MAFQFSKYQGAGNDFVMVDNRSGQFAPFQSQENIARLCHRHFGIGADGLILLEESTVPGSAFKMVYYNSDGAESTMCGNGGRCVVAYAAALGLASSETTFEAIDGVHQATLHADAMVNLHMVDVEEIKTYPEGYFVHTGSPHFVVCVPDPAAVDVAKEGKFWRHHERFGSGGTNVNFISLLDDGTLRIRTFERGVEAETLACGTGNVAAALVAHALHGLPSPIGLHTEGGPLKVSFEVKDKGYAQIWLYGPSLPVFDGTWHGAAL